jgi:hypothetical protein
MYFKKQLFFSLFILIILSVVFYKQTTIKNRIKNSNLTNVEIVNTYCSNRLSKNNYSYFEFKYLNNIYKQSVSGSKCKEISTKQKLSLYYFSKGDEFFLPEIAVKNYYRKFIIILAIILVLGLIPYKSFLK